MGTVIWVGIGIASGLGAVIRYAITAGWEQARNHRVPWGTAFVNVTGALLLGLLVATDSSAATTRLVGIGFLGSFTTYSTWMMEAVFLAATGSRPDVARAVGWITGMAVLGVVAFGAGQAL